MDLTLYAPSTPTDLTAVAINSATDRTALADPIQLVAGNQEALTLRFADENGSTPSWVTDAAVALTVGLGCTDSFGTRLYALGTLTVSGSTRVGTLDLNTAALRDGLSAAIAVATRAGRPAPLGAWLTLEVRKTDASGNRETIGLLPVYVLGRVLSATPGEVAPDSAYVTVAEARYLAPLVFFGSATDEQVFGYFYAERATKILGLQIAAQTAPAGSGLTVDLVDSAGAEQGKIGTLAAGAKQQRTEFATALEVAAGTEWRGKIKSVGSTTPGGYLTVSLVCQPNP